MATSSKTISFEGLDLSALADALAPLVLDRVRAGLPAELRGMLGAAAEVPGLDPLAVAAIADWLEERGIAATARKVRALPLRGGDLIVVQPDAPASRERMDNLDVAMRGLIDHLARGGRQVLALVLPHGISLSHLTFRGPPDAA